MSRDGGGARAGGRHGFAFDSFIFKKKNQDFVEVQMSSLAMVFLNNPETPKPCGEHMTACPWVVEEGSVYIIYDHNTQNLHFRARAHCVCLFCDFCLNHLLWQTVTPHTSGPLISYGVISGRLPSLIRAGTVTLQATTTKHARQVWLPHLPQIDIKLSHRASAIKQARTVSTQSLQSKVTDGLAGFAPQPMCDRCFKEFFDSLTSLHHTVPPFPSSSFTSFIPFPPFPSLSLPSLLPVVFLSQPSWLNLQIPAGGSDFPALTVTVVKSALHVLTQGRSDPAAIDEWAMNEVWPVQHLQDVLVIWTVPCEVLLCLYTAVKSLSVRQFSTNIFELYS